MFVVVFLVGKLILILLLFYDWFWSAYNLSCLLVLVRFRYALAAADVFTVHRCHFSKLWFQTVPLLFVLGNIVRPLSVGVTFDFIPQIISLNQRSTNETAMLKNERDGKYLWVIHNFSKFCNLNAKHQNSQTVKNALFRSLNVMLHVKFFACFCIRVPSHFAATADERKHRQKKGKEVMVSTYLKAIRTCAIWIFNGYFFRSRTAKKQQISTTKRCAKSNKCLFSSSHCKETYQSCPRAETCILKYFVCGQPVEWEIG